MPLGITVIICCFNSEKRIVPTLQHLYKQENISTLCWEIIVVNNCCTDNTVGVIQENWSSFPSDKPKLKIVDELKPGLSSARQKGIDESSFDYIIFCDDDNWLDKFYLSIALEIMKNNPTIGALGGQGVPMFEKEEPPYFWINQYHTLAIGLQSAIDGDITHERGVLYGAGLVLNKFAYDRLINTYNFKFQVSDRVGDVLLSSGDHELCLALKRIGYKIFFSKNLRFTHFLPATRTTIAYYKKLYIGFGMSFAALHVYRLDKLNYKHIRNDFRYVVLRCVKNIILLKTKLLIKGFYVNDNKYKNLDDLHALYNNIGQLRFYAKQKNEHRVKFLDLPLFNSDFQ